MTAAQQAWYGLMIANEKEKEFEKTLSFIEYHAAFTNAEGVKKMQELRASAKEGAIKETEEFLENAKTNEFKNNPLIEAIKKLRENSKKPLDDNPFSSMNLNKLIREDI